MVQKFFFGVCLRFKNQTEKKFIIIINPLFSLIFFLSFTLSRKLEQQQKQQFVFQISNICLSDLTFLLLLLLFHFHSQSLLAYWIYVEKKKFLEQERERKKSVICSRESVFVFCFLSSFFSSKSTKIKREFKWKKFFTPEKIKRFILEVAKGLHIHRCPLRSVAMFIRPHTHRVNMRKF